MKEGIDQMADVIIINLMGYNKEKEKSFWKNERFVMAGIMCCCEKLLNDNDIDNCFMAINRNDYDENLDVTIDDCNAFRYEVYKCPHCGSLVVWDRETQTISYYKPEYLMD